MIVTKMTKNSIFTGFTLSKIPLIQVLVQKGNIDIEYLILFTENKINFALMLPITIKMFVIISFLRFRLYLLHWLLFLFSVCVCALI